MARIDTSVSSSSVRTSPASPINRRAEVDSDSRYFFDLSLFEAATLTVESLPTSVQQLEEHLDASTVSSIVLRSTTLYGALEYILSATSEPSCVLISQWLLGHFPTSLSEFFEPTLAARCLARLAMSLGSSDVASIIDSNAAATISSTFILASAVLRTLVGMFDENTFADADGSATRGIKQRRKSKASSRVSVTIDDKPFKDYGAQIPASREEALALVESILQSQRLALQELLSLTRRPELKDKLRDDFLIHGPNSDGISGIGSMAASGVASNESLDFEDLHAYLTYPSPNGFGRWRILLAGRAARDIDNLRKSGSGLYDVVIQKLRELSWGQFSLANHKKISHNSPVPIFEVRLPSNPRLIYQIDCVRETKNDTPRQVLLVYGLYDHKGVSRTPWDKYGKQQARRGPAYVSACRHRSQPRVPGSDVFEPAEFPNMTTSLDMVHSLPDVDEGEPDTTLSKAEARELHSLLVLGRHAILSQNFLESLKQNDDIAQIHQLSDRERDVVEHGTSCFVIGRSGTGKTTTILFKIFGIERAWEHLSHARSLRPRQLFITKSSLLAKKVEQEFISFIKYDTMAEHAPHHFIQRVARAEDLDTDALFTNEDLGEWRKGLPLRYSELTDEHFPLFLTYDELCTMLENDFKAEDDLREAKSAPWNSYPRYDSDDIVDFDVFTEHYWSRLPTELTRQTVPSVAYGEFVGVCEGSEETLSAPHNRLSRGQYEERRVQHIDYAHFEAYLHIKAQRHERDAADRAHDLLRRLESGTFPGRRIDFLYVDEVQDNILVEISLLRRICRNPNGLFWAGDTAQTISHGSAFRFADLTAFLYRFEQNLIGLGSQPTKPAFFQLAINYRSPGGVVDCARSVVDLLKLFPRAVDNLDREAGIIQGLRPLFIGRDAATVAQEFFRIGPDGRAEVVLGHNQCILVRDEAARARLKKDLNLVGVGIILTIYDSKGLEFDDILLYDFFADSAVDVRLWRHLFEACGDISGPEVKRYDIEDRRHSPLAAELKHLYVAVTRTRRNLWILETSNDHCEPMKDYWSKRGLVEDASAEVTLAGFSEISAAKDWARTAGRLFTRRNYEEAALAFERAGDERRARLSEAFLAKKSAGSNPGGRRRREAYEAAASRLLVCAAEASIENEIKGIFGAVADCYVELNDHERAAGAFEQAHLWSKAADHYFKAKALDKAVALVKEDKARMRAEIDGRVRNKIVETAKCAYLESLRIQEARELFDAKDEEDLEEFVESHDFIDAQVQLLEDRLEVAAAARLLYDEGQAIRALEKLVLHGEQKECVSAALDLGFRLLRAQLSLGTHTLPPTSTDEGSAVAELLSKLPIESLDQNQRRELALYQDVKRQDWAALKRGGILAFVRPGGAPFGLLCFDKYFSDMSHVGVDDPASLLTFVDLFGRYVRQMREVIMYTTLDNLQLLGIHRLDDDHIELFPGTIAGSAYLRRHGPDTSLRIRHTAVIGLIRSQLSIYLKQKIHDQLAKIQTAAQIFNACTTLSRTGICRKVHTVSVAHDLDEHWYNKRIQFHLQQIEILHIVHQIPHAEDFRARIVQQMTWLARLENSLNPLIFLNGSQSVFDPSAVTVAEHIMPIVKQWCLDVLYHLDPTDTSHQHPFLNMFLIAAKLGMRIDVVDKSHIMERQLATVPCITDRRKTYSRLIYREPKGTRFYVLPYVANYLRGFGNVKQGVEFLNTIVERELPVDFGTLCDFADRLTGVFILTRTYQRTRSVHEVTLPRSWAVELWSEFYCYREHNTAHPARLVDILGRLLVKVHGDVLYQRPKAYLDLPRDAARDACMSRICRDLILVGYNIAGPDLRDNIVRVIKSFKKNEVTTLPLSRPYLLSDNWTDLAMAAIHSCGRHISDNMIQLCFSGSPRRPPLASSDIEQVFFQGMADIPVVLGFGEDLAPTDGEQGEGVHREAVVQASSVIEHDSVASDVVVSSEPQTADNSFVSTVQEGADEASRDVEDEGELPQVPSEYQEEQGPKLHAVRIIQEAWHWRRPPQGTLSAALHRRIREHRARASSLSLTPTYRAVFIVHLPRLLLSVEHILVRSQEERNSCKRQRLRAARVQDLDLQLELSSRTKELHSVERAAAALNSALRPESNLHSRAGTALSEVRKCVHELQRLVVMVPLDNSLNEVFQLALRGIEHAGTRNYRGTHARPGEPGVATKPVLNTKDL
ncbi:unnamed protein product [Peniophora sp. CBMAI 1063]|nr:unnamed protein product [Peniophora sp. CBMAI 1063]